MQTVYCSDSIKKTNHWQDIMSALKSCGLDAVTHYDEINLCSRNELDSVLENTQHNSSIICFETEDFLLKDEIQEFENHFVYLLDFEQLSYLTDILKLSLKVKQNEWNNYRKSKIAFTQDTIQNADLELSEEDLNCIFHLKVYLNLYKTIEQVLVNYNKYLLDLSFKIQFSIIHDENVDLRDYYFLASIKPGHLIAVEVAPEVAQQSLEIIAQSLFELNSFVKSHGLSTERNAHSHWENIFSMFPIPIAVMTDNGELLYHNTRFSKLNLLPKQCLELQDNQKIEVNDKILICHKKDFEFDEENLLYFQFLGQEAGETKINYQNSNGFQDLGIISSSIAHELNNPLAGILSALEVLTLLGNKNQSEIEDIKKAANRCKELVSVFLGFAKSRLSKEGDNCSVIKMFQNAQSLLRFRMIEAGVRFDFQIIEAGQLKNEFNSSILTMIYYLILSDILTAYEHEKLVTDKTSGESLISGNFICSSHSMRISLDSDELNISEIKFNRLIQNLLKLEKLTWELEGKGLQLQMI